MEDEVLSAVSIAEEDKETPEETLSTPPAPPASPLEDPARIDVTAFIAGILPIRRAVTIYARGDLLATLDVLAERISKNKLSGENVEYLEGKAAEIVEEIQSNCLNFVVEGRSGEWVKEFFTRMKEQGISETDSTIMQVAEQIVEPAGVTYELLKQIIDKAGVQAAKLSYAVIAANSGEVEIPAPFLQRP